MKGLLLAIFIGTAIVSGCTPQSSTSAQEASRSAIADLTFENFNISPGSITVKPGQIVTISNRDTAGHTVTSDTAGLFETELIGSGQSASFTAPSEPGSYPFHCEPHPSIKGTLVVQ